MKEPLALRKRFFHVNGDRSGEGNRHKSTKPEFALKLEQTAPKFSEMSAKIG